MKEIKGKDRKLIAIGGSIGITVPKLFLEKNKLRRGDSVGITYDDVLMICVPRLPQEEKLSEDKDDP